MRGKSYFRGASEFFVGLIAVTYMTIAGCGGGGCGDCWTGPVSNPITFGGSVTGLRSGASAVLDIRHPSWSASGTVSTNSAFTIEQVNVASPLSYSLTIASQPTGQICSVSNGNGEAVPEATINNLLVDCSGSTYNVAIQVSGVVETQSQSGTNLVLLNNGNDSLSVTQSNVVYNFNTPLANGSAYAVTVQTQPTGHTCSVTNGIGVLNSNNVEVIVICN